MIFLTFQAHGQITENRSIVWVIPSVNTRINGLAGGLMINSFKDNHTGLTTEINGLNFEFIGIGFLLPIVPSSPIYSESDSFKDDIKNMDSLINSYNYSKYCINGVSISAGGIGGHDININGLNISGINTLTGMMNGFSACILINISGVVNGVSIGGLVNNTIQSKGLQIGLFNKTTRLRGFQVGLWNENEKRCLPIINWNFK